LIPFASALFTLSLVILPTTKFGKRYFRVTKRFKTAVWRGLSATQGKTESALFSNKAQEDGVRDGITHQYTHKSDNSFLTR
jgi:hypothetical protein